MGSYKMHHWILHKHFTWLQYSHQVVIKPLFRAETVVEGAGKNTFFQQLWVGQDKAAESRHLHPLEFNPFQAKLSAWQHEIIWAR